MSAKPDTLTSPVPFLESLDLAANSRWLTTTSIVLSDILTLSCVFGVTVAGRHFLTPTYHLKAYLDMLPAMIMILAAFSIQGLYPGLLLHPAEEMRRIFLGTSTVFLIVASATFIWRSSESYSRSVFLVTWVAGAPIILLVRHLVRFLFAKMPWWGVGAVVIGSGAVAQRIIRGLFSDARGVKVVGVLSDDQAQSWPDDLPPLLGDPSHAPFIAGRGIAQYAIVAMPQRSSSELRCAIQNNCWGFSHVLIIPDMPGICSLGIAAREVGGELGLEVPQHLFHRSAAVGKRAIDLIASVLLLVCFAPLFLLVALSVKLSSRGPIFYGHTRRGRWGRTFKALKFRTMVTNADHVLETYLVAHPEALLEWARDQKLKRDPRVTSIGKWMRRLSLDELPQLVNVFLGQMSLVGPRPIVQSEIEKYGAGYNLYTRVRPGITGLWQVSGRNDTTYDERVTLDEYYVRNWSVWIDLYILIRTVKVVLFAKGAY